jgi:hypothetical protein
LTAFSLSKVKERSKKPGENQERSLENILEAEESEEKEYYWQGLEKALVADWINLCYVEGGWSLKLKMD